TNFEYDDTSRWSGSISPSSPERTKGASAGLAQQRLGTCTDVVDGEAVFAQQNLCGCGRAESLHAHHVADSADVAVPTLRHARLDCQACTYRRKQYGITLGRRQSVEQLPARHRHAAYGDSPRLQALRGGDDQANFRAAGD